LKIDIGTNPMDATRRNPSDGHDGRTRDVLVIGGNHFGLAVAEYLTEGSQSVTLVSDAQPTEAVDGVHSIDRRLSNAEDVRALVSEIAEVDLVVVVASDSESLLLGHLVRRECNSCDVVAGISNPAYDSAFEGTGVDRIDIARLLAEHVRDQYK
jgi:Trk K+ transport system NAD-binding subunit